MKKKLKKIVMKQEDLTEVLRKKAVGYKVEESVCEYGIVEDECKLIKKKVSEKYYPPDLSALQLLLNNEDENEYSKLSDQELEIEKFKLLKFLNEGEKDGN